MMKRLLILPVLVFVLAACGGAEPTPIAVAPAAEPTAVPAEPTAVVVEPTAEPPTPLPQPTDTLPAPVVVEEPATPTMIPACTPPACDGGTLTCGQDSCPGGCGTICVMPETTEPAVEPTVGTEAASGGVTLLSSADFSAENRNPLTGEILDEASLNRRPILCKISNSPPEWVRPQSGLNSADIMFEHYTEGTITRFSALFYGKTPKQVGPVRSARLIDLELPQMYQASLCFSGGSSGEGQFRGVYNKVFDQQFAPYILLTASPGYFRTGENKPYEHTFYNNLATSWQHLSNIGQNQRPNYVTQMAFSDEAPVNSAEAGHISINYGSTFVDWWYNSDLGKYERWAEGNPVIDANDGQQVAVSNVIVIKAPHIIDYNICETQTETECIAFSTEIQIWGSGFASIFRDGRQINGSWHRDDRSASGMMFTFKDDAGNPLPLAIGNSWIQVVPYEYLSTPIVVEP